MAESISRKDTSAAFLAATIDGEGCIYSYFRKQTNPRARHCNTLSVAVTIWNTNPLFIRRVTECLIKLEVPFAISLSQNKNGKRTGIQVVIQGKGRTEKLLRYVLPYIGGKRKQVEIALKVIEYRNGLVDKARQAQRGTYEFMRLDQDETLVSLIDNLKKEKHEYPCVTLFSREANKPFGESSETLRLSPFPEW